MAKIATCTERLNELFDSDPRNDSAIGDFLGVSKQTISAWRNGTRSPKKSMVAKIAEAYSVSEEWLYGWDMPEPHFVDGIADGEERERASELRVLFRGMNKLSKSELDRVRGVVEAMYGKLFDDEGELKK